MLFNLESIIKENKSSFTVYYYESSGFEVCLRCKFGELIARDPSLTDGITKVLNSYNVLKENEVTVEKVPF